MKSIQEIIFQCDASVRYQPFDYEIDYNNCSLFTEQHGEVFVLPNDKTSNPFVWAEKCIDALKNKNPYIIIPGSTFDVHGTRHGRGGGWYDRFLSRIPKEWVRIGICSSKNFSSTPLIRQQWDEPVDWVLVYDGINWREFETHARI